MNCPICNKELTLIKGHDTLGNPRFNYVCEAEPVSHFMTDCYTRKEDAMAEVQSGNSFSKTSNMAYWRRGKNNEVFCSHCSVIVGNASTDGVYQSVVENNKFCKSCGRSMKAEIIPTVNPEQIPLSITISDYNKIWCKKYEHAYSFVKLLESAVQKTNDSHDIMKQLNCIGWPEVQPTLLSALEMYKDILKSKCANRTCKTKYRQVTICENCGNCVTITDDGCICKLRGVMPIDGWCSYGYPRTGDTNE